MMIINLGDKELPEQWVASKLPDFTNVVMGQSPSSDTYNLNGNGLPFFQGKAEFGSIYPKVNKYCSKPNKIAEEGATLLSVRAPVGPTNLAKTRCCIGRGLAAIHPICGVDPKFILFLFRSIESNLSGEGTGSTFKAITKAYVDNLTFALPPLNEQKRIVAKIEELFSELDNGIAALKTAREQLKVYRQAILKYAFEGKLTAKWREENADKLETPEQLLTRIQQEREARYQQQFEDWIVAVKEWESKGKEGKKPNKPKTPDAFKTLELDDSHYLASMPKEWISIKARYLCDFITKGTTPAKSELFSNNGDVPFIKVYNLTKSSALDFSIDPTFVSNETHNGFLARSKVYPNDVLMNIVGPPLGKVSIVPDSFTEWNINQAIAIYRSNILSSRFLAEFLLFESTVNFMMTQSKATAGQFNLTLEICRELPIPLTTPEEQDEIVKRLEEQLSNLDSVSKEIGDQLAKAETLRQSILKKAFSGQLVPQDVNDEPASKLLMRIKAEKATQVTTKATHKKQAKQGCEP